jgi:hypothetical protein
VLVWGGWGTVLCTHSTVPTVYTPYSTHTHTHAQYPHAHTHTHTHTQYPHTQYNNHTHTQYTHTRKRPRLSDKRLLLLHDSATTAHEVKT